MSEQEVTLDEVLSPDAEEQPEAEEQKVEAEQEDESHEVEAQDAGDEDGSTPEPEKDEKREEWTLAAVLDEREKRQKAQAELDDLKAKLAEYERPETPRPDVFEDPDGAFNHLEQRLTEERRKDRFVLSREMMILAKDDYEEREEQFAVMAKDDPVLVEGLRASSNPARFAYETVVKAEQEKELSDPEAIKAKLREEIRAELMAEGQLDDPKPRTKITPSLASNRSVGGTREPLNRNPHLDDFLDR